MSDPSFNLRVKSEALDAGAWLVHADGAIDASSAAYFEKQLAAIFEKQPTEVLIDVGHVNYVSSNGLGVLIAVFKRCRDRSIAFHIYDAQLPVRRVLEISKLNFLMLDPVKVTAQSPFAAYLNKHEPERRKKREEIAKEKRPPRLYS